jgi:hypothetical protein
MPIKMALRCAVFMGQGFAGRISEIMMAAILRPRFMLEARLRL